MYCKMITTISVVNIRHHTVKFLFLAMKTFNSYSLSNFQVCNTVLLTSSVLLYEVCRFFHTLVYFFSLDYQMGKSESKGIRVKKKKCPGQATHLVRALSLYTKVVGWISGQGAYKNQLMNA